MMTIIRNRWKGLVACAVLIAVVAVTFRPAMTRIRSWRAGRLLDEAREFADSEDWNGALRTSLASAQLAPSIDSIRLYFEAQRHAGDANLLQTAGVLGLHPQATDDDRANVLAIFLDVGDLIGFSNVLRSLPEGKRAAPEVRFQVVRFLLGTGKLEEAVKLADEVPERERTADFDVLLVSALIRARSEELRERASERLARLLEHPDREVALDALRILADQPDGRAGAALAQKAVERFGGDTALGVPERFAVLKIKLGLVPQEQRSMLVEGVIADYKDQHLDSLLKWLLVIGENEKVVDLTDSGEKPGQAFWLRATALRTLERYDQLGAELDDLPAGTQPVEAAVARASVAHLLGNASAEVSYWQEAFSYAELRPSENQFYKIARAAAQVGAEDQSMEALARGVEHKLGVPPLAGELAPLFDWLAKKDAGRLLSISRRLLHREPGNPLLINNYHYLLTLYRMPDKDTIPTLEKLVEAFPDTLSYRGSLAFAQVKSGDPNAALKTLDGANVEPGSLRDPIRAVYAAALAALDRQAEADTLQQSIDWMTLHEGESKVFKAMIKTPAP